MTRIRQTIAIDAPPAALWDAIADVSALHTRVAPGMVLSTELANDGAVRIVTFANGAVLHEAIVSLNHETRELVWSAQGGPCMHHNASLAVTDCADGGGEVTWTADVLPDSAGEMITGFVTAGLQTMKAHFESPKA